MKPKHRILLCSATAAILALGVVIALATRDSRKYRRAVDAYRAQQFVEALRILDTISPEYREKPKAQYLKADSFLNLANAAFEKTHYHTALLHLGQIPEAFTKYDQVRAMSGAISQAVVRIADEQRAKELMEVEARERKAGADREKAEQRELALQDRESNRREAQERFKHWALSNLAVTDIAINSSTLFVTLTPDKYTSKANVEEIAHTIARYYCLQTNERGAVCRVYWGKELYAKGTYMP